MYNTSNIKNNSMPMMGLLANAQELISKILFTFLILIIYRFGTYVPLPGINALALLDLNDVHDSGILSMFNMFTGGALGRMSIFSLNIMPYITASIIMQLLTAMYKTLENMKKEGAQGRRKITQLTRYLTILIAIVQSYGFIVGAENLSSPQYGELVVYPGFWFRISSVLNLTAGTILVMWLGEQISSRGIGNGSSLIIFVGIISGLPSALASLVELGRNGAFPTSLIILILALVLMLILTIVFFEKGQRRIMVQYPRRQVGMKVYAGDSSYLPLKINTAGVIPPIFASSLLLFPLTLLNFSAFDEGSIWQGIISGYFVRGSIVYNSCFTLLIIFFCFFYTSIIFNPDETADNLKKSGAVIPGHRPGDNTAKYLDSVLSKITTIGALYISFVCIVPELLMSKFSLPFYLGGTSLLIVVNVVLDFYTQIQTHLISSQYEHLIKKSKLNIRKK